MNVPFVPLTVMVNVPTAAAVLTPTVMTDVPVAVTGFTEKITAVFAGFPEALSVTELLPPTAVTVMVEVPRAPRATLRDDGDAEIVKSGDEELTVSVIVVL